MHENLRLVIVEDNKAFRKVLKIYIELKECGSVVGEASCAEDYLNNLNHIACDIILMDICMPGMSGIELCKHILSQNKQARIIAISQYNDQENMKSMKKAGALGYVNKQDVGEHLLKAIEEILKGHLYFPNS